MVTMYSEVVVEVEVVVVEVDVEVVVLVLVLSNTDPWVALLCLQNRSGPGWKRA